MFYLEDICFLCLKNNLELHSVFVKDIDGIYFNVKLRCCFPEIFDSTPDEYKLACLECFAKLRFLYESKQSVICSSTVMRNYLDKLQFENKTLQQPSVVLSGRKRRRKDSNTKKLPEVKIENVANGIKLKITNFNLNSTNKEQVNIAEYSCQPTANENVTLLTNYNCLIEEKDLETKNVEKFVPFTETETICVKQEPQFSNLNLNSANEQLNTVDHSCQSPANKNETSSILYNCLTVKKDLETKNVEKYVPVTETETIYVKQEQQFSEHESTTGYLDKEIEDSKDTETIYIKQEPQFCEDDSTTDYLDKESEDSEESTSSNEDDPDFEISEEETSRPNDYNNQKINAIRDSLKPCYVSDDSVKFCNTCQDLLFRDLNNINVHLQMHIPSTSCSRCEDSLKDIHKFQRHMFNHCEPMFEILDKGEHGEEFSCAVCDQQFDEFNNLKQHISDKHIRSLKCVVCSRGFCIKPNVLRHILDKHCHVKLYKCKICPTRFVSKNGIKDHMIYKHYSGKGFVCKCCYQSFTNPKTLQEHISNFHGADLRLEENTTHDSSKKDDSVEKFSCVICHKQFNIGDNLRKHIFDMHVNSLQCEICSKTYTRKVGKVKHILVNHCRVKLYKCIICAKKFSHKKMCNNHMLKKHNNGNAGAGTKQLNKVIVTGNRGDFSCQICNIQFTDFETSKKHISDEHMPNLVCVICYRSYLRKEKLHRHILELHCDVNLFECRICSEQFISNESFRNHMNREHNVRDTTPYRKNKIAVTLANGQKVKCTICQTQFDSFENLKQHIYEVHMIGSDCVVCSKSYSRRTELNRHILEIHCHLKVTYCKHCPQRFVCKRIFEDHLDQQHSTDKELDNEVCPVTLLNGEKATCTICHQQFDVFENIRQHIYDEHITGSDCVVCSKTFGRRRVLNRHIMEQHCYLKIINCKLCPQRFAWKESLTYHMNQHHSSDGVGEITELNNEFGAVTELDNKVSAVTEVEKKFSAVLEPEEIFIKEDRYYSDEYDSSDEEYEADNYETRKDFSNFAMAEESNSHTSNSSNLKESIGSSVIPNATATTTASYCEPSAPVDQSEICYICQEMFLYLSNLSEHLNAHMQESSCSMCNDSAENIRRLQCHMLTPCGNTNISHDSANTANILISDKVTCVVCQKEFKSNILKKHMRSHITDLTCVVCNKTISSKTNLQRHLVHHCNLKIFQCEVCDKKFTAKESLKYHMDATHYSQIVSCQHCQRTLRSTKSLRVHIRTMHPEFLYQCVVCKRIFIHKNELLQHAKVHTFSQ